MQFGYRANPYPVRAAIQIGSDNAVSTTVARVDVSARAVRDFLFHTEVPFQQNSTNGASHNNSLLNPVGPPRIQDGVISEVTNLLRKVTSAIRSQQPSEVSLLLMPPFDRVENTKYFSQFWSKEFRCKVQLFQNINFCSASLFGEKSSNNNNHNRILDFPSSSFSSSSSFDDDEGNCNNNDDLDDDEMKRNQNRFEMCWFMAHVAASKHLAPERLVVLRENDGSNIQLIGIERKKAKVKFQQQQQQQDKKGTDKEKARETEEEEEEEVEVAQLRKLTLPNISVPQVHRLLYEEVQRRPIALYKGINHSVNPLHRSEINHLAELVRKEITSNLNKDKRSNKRKMNWLDEKMEEASSTGLTFCGSSPSVSGLLNTCARVAGSVSISVEKLEQTTEFHYGGLSETMLSNFPQPSTIVAQSVLLSSLCRTALKCRRVSYLPEVDPTHAMLVHPDFWFFQSASHRETEGRYSAGRGPGRVVPVSQEVFDYPQQAVDRFDPHRLRR